MAEPFRPFPAPRPPLSRVPLSPATGALLWARAERGLSQLFARSLCLVSTGPCAFAGAPRWRLHPTHEPRVQPLAREKWAGSQSVRMSMTASTGLTVIESALTTAKRPSNALPPRRTPTAALHRSSHLAAERCTPPPSAAVGGAMVSGRRVDRLRARERWSRRLFTMFHIATAQATVASRRRHLSAVLLPWSRRRCLRCCHNVNVGRISAFIHLSTSAAASPCPCHTVSHSWQRWCMLSGDPWMLA